MAEGRNKREDDYYSADNFAVQAEKETDKFRKGSTNYQGFNENFPTQKALACFLGNPIDPIGCGNVKKLERFYSDSPKHKVEDHSSGSCAQFSLNSKNGEIYQELISEGKVIADLIVGSHRALIDFQSFYDEWAVYRTQSLNLLQQLNQTIRSSFKRTEKIKNVICGIELAQDDLRQEPNPGWSFGARIAAMISTLVLRVFGSNFSKKDVEEKELEIRLLFQKDIDASSSVYIRGMQCSSQFEATCKAIRNFCSKIQPLNLNAVVADKVVIEFLAEISDYNPSNVSVFYKILRKAYERLIKESNSKESRDLIKVFETVPEAINVINLVCWRFDTDGFENTITQRAWDDLFDTFINSETHDLNYFLSRIQDCIFFLQKEQKILERSVINLRDEKS